MATPPPSEDLLFSGEMRARAELLLAAILRVLLVMLPVLIAAALFVEQTTQREITVLCISAAFVLGLHLLLRRGYFVFCSHALVFGFIAISIVGLASYGSIRAPGSVAVVAAITFGGIFLGRRTLVLAALLSVFALGCLVYAQRAGWLPPPDYRVTFGHWLIYSTITLSVALVLNYMRSLLFDLVKRLQAELAQRQKAEAGREQSDERFRRVFDTSPLGMTITRVSDGRYLEANPADERTLGYRREELTGRTSLELGAWPSAEDRERFLGELRRGKGVHGFETQMRHRSGAMITCRIWAEYIDFGGEQCVLATTINVTEQELAERQLADSEERFSKAFQATREAIAISHLPDGRITSVNQRFEELYGAPAAEIVGRNTQELKIWGPETRQQLLEQLRAGGAIRDAEVRFQARSGEIRLCEYSAEALDLGGERHAIAFLRDVTTQRRVEDERREAHELFSAAFSNSPDGILITRLRDGKVLRVNDAWIAINGFRREDVIGRSLAELGVWTVEERAGYVERLRRDGRISNYLAHLRRRDGSIRQTLLSAMLIEMDGESCVMSLGRDVTEQLRAEEAKRQALERFQKVFDHSPDSIAISRLRDGEVIAVNDAWVRLNGYAREQVVGHPASGVGQWLAGEREQVMAQVRSEGRVVNRLTSFRRPDGSLRQSLISVTLIDVDGEQCTLFIGRDVTEQQRIEEELRGNRRLLETVIDAIPMAIFAKDLDSNYIMLNKRMAEFFGVQKEVLLRRHTSNLPAGGAARSKSLKDDAWVFENRRMLDQPDQQLERPDGVLMHYHSTKIPLFDETGKLMGLLGINRDIGDEKRAQQALRDSEHRYRSLFQAAMDCILVLAPDGAIIDINEFGCRSLGYTREELIGGTFSRILDETKLSRMLPRPATVKVERRTLRAEQDVRAKDGSMRAVEFTAGPLPDGNLLVVARDVTERRRNEQLLENIAKGVSSQTGEEFFRSLVLALGAQLPADTVFIGEIVGKVIRTMACCSDGELAGNFDYPLAGSPCLLAISKRGTVVHPDYAARAFPEDKVLASRGIAGCAATSLFDASGKAVGILVALTRKPIERKEFVVSMLEIFAARAAAEIERASADARVRELNISLERRVRERTSELEAANRDLDSFGYSVSHDLRSPLGALNGFAHLLRTREAERLSADGVHLLRQLETNATRMTNLVEGLLEFSRLGRKPVTRVAVQMPVLVADVVDELRAGHGERRLDFRVRALSDAYGDPMLLRQVWLNLIGNAIKYSRGRDPALIEVGSDPATGEYFVRDNGAGFDMKYAERLFGVFERLHSESEFEGTGIGLAIVQRIVNRHGGMVRGEGHLGQGATFRFTLPAR